MDKEIRTNKHKERNLSYNEWINEWINTYEQMNIKIKAVPAMNVSIRKNKLTYR